MLAINDWNVHFGEQKVLHSLRWQIRPGECHFINAPSGEGKSTFLRSLVFLVPSQGQLLFNGNKVSDIPTYRSKVMYLPSWPSTFGHTVLEYFLFPKTLSCHKNRVVNPLLLLEKVGMENVYKKNIQDLSTGQLKTVQILRAMLYQPQILLLDEPLANMDNNLAQNIQNLLLSWPNTERALIIAGHQIPQIPHKLFRLHKGHWDHS